MIKRLKYIFVQNRNIVENYFYMTFLQVLNSFFYIFLYPYLIRVLGSESYGLYVYATSIITYFIFLINFGFDLPATRLVAINTKDKKQLEVIVSTVFVSKNFLFILSALIFIVLLNTISIMKNNSYLFLSCFIAAYSYVLLPLWFFQGMQDLKHVTFAQLVFKLLSIPFILTMVNKSEDLVTYAIIVSLTTLASSFTAFIIIRLKYKLKLKLVSINDIKKLLSDSKPFFYSLLAGAIKESSIPIILGSYFGMKEVAIYDLANKIIMVPRTLFMSVNAAIFPKLIANINKKVVRRVIQAEYLIAFVAILCIVLFGKFVTLILGGTELIEAYYLSMPLSLTILSWLVVGAYINFTFIPNSLNHLVTYNQLLATIVFFIVCIGGLNIVWESIYMIGIAMALAALIEILFCAYIVKRLKLL